VSDDAAIATMGAGLVEAEPEIVIITGMSGAGRTQVAKVLEDLDFFVIDNLPPPLLPKVVELAFGPGTSVQRLALVADVRGREFFGQLVDSIRELRDTPARVRLVFLEASDDTLVTRFETTRRRHPAADGGGVLAGIRHERELMSELRGMADLILDTTDRNVHELRDLVVDTLGDPDEATLRIKVLSFGFKHGAPRDADLVFDVRFLPNPHWVDELRPFTGRDEPVREYVLGRPATGPFLEALQTLLDVTVPGYVEEGKRYLTIAIGCTGGKHRSVAIAEHVARYLDEHHDVPVWVEHRDLGEE
jgi:RNase adapter protein RapZ